MGWNPFKDLEEVVNNAVDQTVGKDSYIGSGQASTDISKGAQQVAGNVEKNISNSLNEIMFAISTGNLSNLDQTMMRIAGAGLTGGLSLGLNPDTVKVKETNIERAGREATEKAVDQANAAAAEKERQRLQTMAEFMSANSAARRLAPGSGQTLLGGNYGGTLLTTGGK